MATLASFLLCTVYYMSDILLESQLTQVSTSHILPHLLQPLLGTCQVELYMMKMFGATAPVRHMHKFTASWAGWPEKMSRKNLQILQYFVKQAYTAVSPTFLTQCLIATTEEHAQT